MAPLSAPQILNREFFEIRCKILELAAAMDRLDRAEDSIASDPRVAKLKDALRVVLGDEPHRAEAIQLIFSREYDANWRQSLQVGTGR